MPKCKHLNVTITELVCNRYTYRIKNDRCIDRSADCVPTARTFEVKCHDCDLEKTYHYGPGVFGLYSKPEWLYDRMETTKGSPERIPRGKKWAYKGGVIPFIEPSTL